MKVTLENGYKDLYTLEDLRRAKEVIKYAKEYEETNGKSYCEIMAHEALRNVDDWFVETLKFEAHTAKNCNVWNAYTDDSCDMDIVIEATVRTVKGFLIVCACLTDVWQIGAEPQAHKFSIQHFTRDWSE